MLRTKLRMSRPGARSRGAGVAAVLVSALALSGLAVAAPLPLKAENLTSAHAADPPIPRIGTPTLGSAPRVGTPVTSFVGNWTPGTAFTQSWFVDDVEVQGVHSVKFTPRPEDLRKKLRTVITGVLPGHETAVISSQEYEVLPGVITAPSYRVVGTPQVANTLRAELAIGEWEPSDVNVNYQWFYGEDEVPQSDAPTHVVRPEAVGKMVSVRVIGSKIGYDWKTTRTFVAVAWAGTLKPPSFEFLGKMQVGEAVSVAPVVGSHWEPSGNVNQNYRWFYDGQRLEPIEAYDSPTHVIRPEGVGKALSVEVIGSKIGYDWKHVRIQGGTVAAPDVPFVSAPTPSIAKVQQPTGPYLSARAGVWDPVPGLSYQWFRDGVKLTGPQFDYYRLTPADAGKSFKVQVTGKLTGRITTVRTSAAFVVPRATPVVRRLSATPKPRISGTVRVGKKISVRAGSWKPAKVTLSYRWLRNGKAIRGATKSKYKLTRKDRGKRISVRVTGKKSGYVTVVKTSSAKRVR